MLQKSRKITFILAIISAIIGVMLAVQLRSSLHPVHKESRSIAELRTTLQKELEKHKNLLADISKYNQLYYQYETALSEDESISVMKEELERNRRMAGMVEVEGEGIVLEVVDAHTPTEPILDEQMQVPVVGEYTIDEQAATDVSGEEMPLLAALGVSAFFLLVVGLFTLIGVFSEGATSWFLFFFLIPFWTAFPIAVWGVTLGLIILGCYLAFFLGCKVYFARTTAGKQLLKKWSKRFASSSSGSSSRSGSGWSSSSSSSSSSSFSGGGGSFSGGGSSGSW